MSERGCLVECSGGIRIPKIGPLGPLRLGGREQPLDTNQVVLKSGRSEFGELVALLAIVEQGRIRVTYNNDEATYDAQGGRVVPISPAINRDTDLGGRIKYKESRLS